RSAAMGGASAAVLWGEPGVWANPATLSGVHGLGWVAGHTPIHSEFFGDDVSFASQRLLLGAAGLGFSLMGKPFDGVGKSRYEFGTVSFGAIRSARATAIGSPEFAPFDETKGWGFGVSPLRLIGALMSAGKPNAISLTDRGEVSFGFQGKSTM